MKEVILKREEPLSIITVSEINRDKFFGIQYKNGLSDDRYIIQKSTRLGADGKTFFLMIGPVDFTNMNDYKTLYAPTIPAFIEIQINNGYKAYQFDTLSELAKWAESK